MIALFFDCLPRALDWFWNSVNLERSGAGASFCKESRDIVAVERWVSAGFLILFVMLEYVESRTTRWVKAIWLLGQSNFSLFTSRITRDRFKFERTRFSSLRISGFEMGEYAGELPRKFISFHCLEKESNVPIDHNTEGTENYPDLPHRSEVEIVVIEETETSPTKSLAVLQVTGGKKTMIEERGDVNKESLVVGSHKCPLSSSDEGSEVLEKFLRDKLESFGSDGIENIAEVDPAGVLELLDLNLVDRGNTGSGVVTVDDEIPRGRVGDILRSELREKKIGGGSKRPLCGVDIGVADERPAKSVAFEVDDSGGKMSSERCTLVGVTDAGQSFPSSSRPDDTDYGTSELESIARKRVGSLSGGRVSEAAEPDLPAVSGATVQTGLGAARSKYYPSESARTLLKECFADNPPVQLDPHQQLTGMSSDQMIQFARAVGLEVFLATCWRMCCWKLAARLERMLVRREVDSLFRSVGQGPLSWRVWIHVLFILYQPLQSRLIVIVWRVIFLSNHAPVDKQMRLLASLKQKWPKLMILTVWRLSDRSVLMLGRSVNCIGGREKVGLTQLRPVGRMTVDMFSLRRCWRLPRLRKSLLLVLKIGWKIGIVFTAWSARETYQWNRGACMNWSDTSNRSIIWGLIRGCVPGVILRKHVGQMGVLCMGPSWKLRRSCLCIWMYRNWIMNVRSTMMWLKGSRLPLRKQVRGLWYKLSCCWFFWEEEANFGHWKNTGPRWECWRVILRAPLTSIGVWATFL